MMNKQEELYLGITLFDKDASKKKEYRISNINENSCEKAFVLNEKMLAGELNQDELLHELVLFIVEFFNEQFTYQDVVFGVEPTELQSLISVLFMACGCQLSFNGEQDKSDRLLVVASNLYDKVVK